MIALHLIKKEFTEMFRGWLLPVIFVLAPIALMNMIPRIATQEIKGLRVSVVDNCRSQDSRRLVDRIHASAYISVYQQCQSCAQAMELINSGDVDAIVEINRDGQMQISANATNGTKGAMAVTYINGISSQSIADNAPMPQGPSVRYLYNPTLDYKMYMVPVVFALMLMLIVGFLPALNIVSEKEKGTIEQINVTPIGKFDFIVSKIVPYIAVGIAMSAEGLLAARGLYGIVPAGSVWLVFLFAILFCMLASSFGLIISNYSSTVPQAAVTMLFFLMIFMLTSGLLTPIQSMPEWAQRLTCLNPMRYIIEAMRAVFIKGSTIGQLVPQIAAIAGYSAVCWVWAVRSYRKNG